MTSLTAALIARNASQQALVAEKRVRLRRLVPGIGPVKFIMAKSIADGA
jgi:hypothetical protein